MAGGTAATPVTPTPRTRRWRRRSRRSRGSRGNRRRTTARAAAAARRPALGAAARAARPCRCRAGPARRRRATSALLRWRGLKSAVQAESSCMARAHAAWACCCFAPPSRASNHASTPRNTHTADPRSDGRVLHTQSAGRGSGEGPRLWSINRQIIKLRRRFGHRGLPQHSSCSAPHRRRAGPSGARDAGARHRRRRAAAAARGAAHERLVK